MLCSLWINWDWSIYTGRTSNAFSRHFTHPEHQNRSHGPQLDSRSGFTIVLKTGGPARSRSRSHACNVWRGRWSTITWHARSTPTIYVKRHHEVRSNQNSALPCFGPHVGLAALACLIHSESAWCTCEVSSWVFLQIWFRSMRLVVCRYVTVMLLTLQFGEAMHYLKTEGSTSRYFCDVAHMAYALFKEGLLIPFGSSPCACKYLLLYMCCPGFATCTYGEAYSPRISHWRTHRSTIISDYCSGIGRLP